MFSLKLKRLLQHRCPICGTKIIPNTKPLCQHITRSGKLKQTFQKQTHIQEQKYSLNPLWRGRNSGSKGERR